MKGEMDIEVKVIGSNCSNGMKLKKELKRAIDHSDLEINLTELNDPKDKKKYQIENICSLISRNYKTKLGCLG